MCVCIGDHYALLTVEICRCSATPANVPLYIHSYTLYVGCQKNVPVANHWRKGVFCADDLKCRRNIAICCVYRLAGAVRSCSL